MIELSTIAASSGIAGRPVHGSITPPLYASDTYQWSDASGKPAYDYSRTVNPNRDLLIQALCGLEHAFGGAVTSSGQSAALLALLLLGPAARIIAPHDCYGGTWRLLDGWAKQTGGTVTFIDQRDDDQLGAALAAGADLLWIESPSNPLLRLVDIAKLTTAARSQGILSLADNTVATPCAQQPIRLGCDLVLHSTTKAINGHHDLFGGALLAGTPELVERIDWWCNAAGLAGSAFDAWQTLRGLRTLPVRFERQQQNALHVARFLGTSPRITQVNYPGLSSHPDFQLCLRQCAGPGFMLSFELAGGRGELEEFLSRLSLINLAPSLGGFCTLICSPSTMTHRGMPEDAQRAAGIGPQLVRLSVGLEDANALIDDLELALGDD